MSGYADQPHWQLIQGFLPHDYRLTGDDLPAEEWWEHDGHRIHIDAYRNADAPARVVLLHGVGTNGRQMTTILGRPLAERGFETFALDMPTFGVTQVADGALVTYDDWVRIGADFVARLRTGDDRPIYLFGLSAGGMEAIHIAALDKQRTGQSVAGVVGMTFLDQQLPVVRRRTAVEPVFTGTLGAPMMRALARTPARSVRLPMRLVSKMHTLVNDKDARRVCYADPTSAGNRATIAFLDSYLNYRPPVSPEEFDVCPVLLTQPADDRWTPFALSEYFLRLIEKVDVDAVALDGAGHYPIEQPGLDQLVDAVDGFCRPGGADEPASR